MKKTIAEANRKGGGGKTHTAVIHEAGAAKQKNNADCITEIPLGELYPPSFHPFYVNDDEAMERLVRSVKQYGVREPGLARPRSGGGGGYELLCGNRRKRETHKTPSAVRCA
jgi:ParB family chromosome partitioning protein